MKFMFHLFIKLWVLLFAYISSLASQLVVLTDVVALDKALANAVRIDAREVATDPEESRCQAEKLGQRRVLKLLDLSSKGGNARVNPMRMVEFPREIGQVEFGDKASAFMRIANQLAVAVDLDQNQFKANRRVLCASFELSELEKVVGFLNLLNNPFRR